jgi:RNA polymerase sigma factor (sigma-70 family)
MGEEQTVFIVDDDPAMRESLSFLMGSVALPVETFENARVFMERYDPTRSGCLVLDVRMPGMSGIELQQRLRASGIDIPIIMITGFGDVPMAVRAIKAGALDFIEKPFTDQDLIDRINEALQLDLERRRRSAERASVAARLARLTQRERQVMDLVLSGKANKIVADELGLSPKTVEVHRARVMEKMEVQSLAELMQVVIGYDAARGAGGRRAQSPT